MTKLTQDCKVHIQAQNAFTRSSRRGSMVLMQLKFGNLVSVGLISKTLIGSCQNRISIELIPMDFFVEQLKENGKKTQLDNSDNETVKMFTLTIWAVVSQVLIVNLNQFLAASKKLWGRLFFIWTCWMKTRVPICPFYSTTLSSDGWVRSTINLCAVH